VPRIDWTRVLLVCLAILALAGVALLVWRVLGLVRQTLTVLAAGAALAFIARPLVDRLAGPLRSRGLAVALVALGSLGVTAGGLYLLAGPLAADLRDVLRDLPQWQERLTGALARLRQGLAARGIVFDEADLVRQAGARLQGIAGALLGGAAAVTGRVGALLAGAAAVLVIAVYLLLDGQRIRERFYQFLPEAWRPGVAHVERSTARVFGGYLRGQLVLGLIIGVVVGFGAELFGLPYSALIGLVAGVFELIPSVGAVLGSILPLALALAQPFPTVLYVLAFLVIVSQVENHLLVPRITGQAVGLHPLAALLALFAGFEIGGLVGAFLGAPAASLAYRLLLDWRQGALTSPPAAGDEPPRAADGPGRGGWLRSLLERFGERRAGPDASP